MKVLWKAQEKFQKPENFKVLFKESSEDLSAVVVSASSPEMKRVLEKPSLLRPFTVVIDESALDSILLDFISDGIVTVRDPETALEVLSELEEKGLLPEETKVIIPATIIDTDTVNLEITRAYFTNSFFNEVAEKFTPFIGEVEVQAEFFLVKKEEKIEAIVRSVREKEPLVLMTEIFFSEWVDDESDERIQNDPLLQFLKSLPENEKASLEDLVRRSALARLLVEACRKWKAKQSLTNPVLLTERVVYDKALPALASEGLSAAIVKPLIPDTAQRLALVLLRQAFFLKHALLAKKRRAALSELLSKQKKLNQAHNRKPRRTKKAR